MVKERKGSTQHAYTAAVRRSYTPGVPSLIWWLENSNIGEKRQRTGEPVRKERNWITSWGSEEDILLLT